VNELNRNKPSIKLQAFFRRHFNNVTFIEGTVLDASTLKLAKVSAEMLRVAFVGMSGVQPLPLEMADLPVKLVGLDCI